MRPVLELSTMSMENGLLIPTSATLLYRVMTKNCFSRKRIVTFVFTKRFSSKREQLL